MSQAISQSDPYIPHLVPQGGNKLIKREGRSRLTSTKGNDARFGGAEQARVDALKLGIDDALELGIARSLFAGEGRGDDAVDVERVTRVLAVRDCVIDQRLLVLDPRLLGKVDHRVRVVLLRAGIRVGEQRVDAVYARELDARVAAGVVAARSAALLAQVLPALRDLAQVGLRDAFEEERWGARGAQGALALGSACWRCGGTGGCACELEETRNSRKRRTVLRCRALPRRACQGDHPWHQWSRYGPLRLA